MIILCIVPLSRGRNLRRDRMIRIPLLADLLLDILCGLQLLVTVREDRAAVLGACVGALAVLGRGVVHAEEEFDQLPVGDEGGVEEDLEGFGIWRWC